MALRNECTALHWAADQGHAEAPSGALHPAGAFQPTATGGRRLKIITPALGLQPPPFRRWAGGGFRGSNHLLRRWLEHVGSGDLVNLLTGEPDLVWERPPAKRAKLTADVVGWFEPGVTWSWVVFSHVTRPLASEWM